MTANFRADRPTAAPGRRVLVLGGARSGKSAYAESLVGDHTAVGYVAPGPLPTAEDPEWAARVLAHQRRRPPHWHTHETLDVANLLATPGDPLLIDCLSTWLSGTMDVAGVWAGDGDDQLAAQLDELVAAWTATVRDTVAVSSEVGLSVVPETASGRRYRDELGRLNARIAAASDEVWFVLAGLPMRVR